MFEYDSVSTPTYDLAGLVSKLNERAAVGWDVVSIVPTGGDVTAILKRDKGGTASDSAATTEAIPELERRPADDAAEPADAAASTPPADTGAVSEPSGWAAAPAATAAPEPTPQPAPEPVAAAPAPQPTPQPTPQPQPSTPSTPAGWYPDPSGRFELRYWDGSQWTEYVSRAGQQYTDPPVA
jgi:hypothetical protein